MMIAALAALMLNMPPLQSGDGQVCVVARGCFPVFLVQRLQVGQTRENYVVQVLQPLRAADVDNDGLDVGDLDLVRRRAEAQQRAQRLSMVMGYDLDGDLRITRAEAMRAVQPGMFGARQVDQLFQEYDLNGDGVIEAAEVVRKPLAANGPSSFDLRGLEQMMALAINGRLTARSLQAHAEKVFDAFDSDHNGVLSADELAARPQS